MDDRELERRGEHLETGFLEEFKKAQQNLAANVAAGRGNQGFRYMGPGTGTSPLPIYLAYFSGINPALANDPSRYTSTNFTNSAWTGHLGFYEPDPQDAANDLHANTTFRANALTAGLPRNFFVMNPAIAGANITRALAGTRYNSVQVDLRRRLSRGLFVNANYTFAKRKGSSLQTLRQDRIYLESTDVPHAFKMQWTYEIPVGRGRRFGANWGRVLDTVLGGWEFAGAGRAQKELYDLGTVRLVGMTKDDLQKAFKIRYDVNPTTGATTVFSMPKDIYENTRRAYNTDPTSATGYSADGIPTGRYIAPPSTPDCIALYAGDCGLARQLLLLGPVETRWDMRIKKRFALTGRANFEVTAEMLNVFDNINFSHNPFPGGGAGTFQVTSAYTDINTTFDPGGRIGQLVFRFNW